MQRDNPVRTLVGLSGRLGSFIMEDLMLELQVIGDPCRSVRQVFVLCEKLQLNLHLFRLVKIKTLVVSAG